MNNYLVTGVSSGLGSSLIFALGIIAIFILLFLLFREIACWYWKVNEIVDLLKKIELNTRPQTKQSPTPMVNQTPIKIAEK